MFNHLDALNDLVNKTTLADFNSRFLPPSFKLPEMLPNIKAYAKENPKTQFITKSNFIRGMKLSVQTI